MLFTISFCQTYISNVLHTDRTVQLRGMNELAKGQRNAWKTEWGQLVLKPWSSVCIRCFFFLKAIQRWCVKKKSGRSVFRSLTYLWRILLFYNRIAYQSPLYAMGWRHVPRPIFLASFEFWRLANHNKMFAHDLVSNQKAHQNSEGTAGRGTKSDLLGMRPDWNRPHTRSDSPNDVISFTRKQRRFL